MRRTARILLGLLAFALALWAQDTAHKRALEGTVVRVVDGDTIHVKIGDRVEKVRYIGINTPELHHPTRGREPGGREAAELNRQLAGGKRVRLELDVQERECVGA
jgi:micrococcal nuclease